MSNEVLVDNLVFPESPRWRDDRLWFVDMFGQRVMTVDLEGHTTLVATFDDRPSGLGFLPDGTPIVVLMTKRQIVRMERGGTSLHADLSAIPAEYLNDMVVGSSGRAYVDLLRPPTPNRDRLGDHCIMVVEPDGQYDVAASGDLFRPNGLVISADGTTLIAAESVGHRLSAFNIDEDGLLSNRRVFAETGEDVPDGICMDEEGAVWIGSPTTNRFVRFRDGGEVAQIIDVEGRWALACVLGGRDRRTLFMATSRVPLNPQPGMVGNLQDSKGFIETLVVDIAGAGIP
jgi:sugar lactone lactonase YvrE